MKFLLILTIVVCACPVGYSQSLLEKRFKVTVESEAVIEIKASAPGSSWTVAGREAAAATVFVDRLRSQDWILFGGEGDFTYKLMLGRVKPGEHEVKILVNSFQSAPQSRKIEIRDSRIRLLDRSDPEFAMVANAPVIYARQNTIGKFTDIPLLIYCETIRNGSLTSLRYTMIFSNEDGGTQTSGLMSRWGRTTDIEWVIETQIDEEGNPLKSIYQGVNHETKNFKGQYEGDHPVMLVASDNNNFSDQGQTEMRFALTPVAADLSRAPREHVMDLHPWTHTIMAQEMIREGKITDERTLGAKINDLRNYLYIDAGSTQQNGSAISFAVKLKNNPLWYTSDLGIGSYKIERSGYFRTSIRLPGRISIDQIEKIAARCDLPSSPKTREEVARAATAFCEISSVDRVFLLDDSFHPGKSFSVRPSGAIKLLHGEMIELPIVIQ